jgi:hypothetical protein
MREDHFPEIAFHDILKETGKSRLAMPGMQEAVSGGLAYLFDTYVHDASAYDTSWHSFLINTSGRYRLLPRLAAGFRQFLGKYIVNEKHLEGSWPGYIHFLADEKKVHARPIFVVTDYNLFTTASTAFPLMLFDDRHLAPENQFLDHMLEGANRTIRGLRRGSAYNFWVCRKHKSGSYTCSGPLNIPVSLIGLRRYTYKFTGMMGLKDFPEAERMQNWVIDCFSKRLNPFGGAAVFNIPNDADNTSMAVSFQLLMHKRKGMELPSELLEPLELLPRFRDLDRVERDRYYKTFGEGTGAFLTWFKDESKPVFEEPSKGIIPLTVNNVDIVINANALFALALSGKTSVPGYEDTISLLVKAIEEDGWMDASLYYPQRYIFPYAISRAWRDAGVRGPGLDQALDRLMIRILEDNISFEGKDGHIPGAFPWNKYDNYIQSTALALITLLNLGRNRAASLGMPKEYDRIVEESVKLLLNGRQPVRSRQKVTAGTFPGTKPNFWESGILYSSSVQQLAHWRSHAQATSLVLEALAKYLLGYDHSGESFLSGKLRLHIDNSKKALVVVSK